jgi:hypothetical protein
LVQVLIAARHGILPNALTSERPNLNSGEVDLMRKFVSLLVCGLVILVYSARSLATKTHQSRRKDSKRSTMDSPLETIMKLRKMKVSCDGSKDNFKEACVSIELGLHCPGTQVSHVGSVSLQLIFETADWNHAHGS